ncbi:MAG TPA: hypothetical protein VHQ23_02750 [Ilumatobacteraceae bacterium]|jgi:hypothetical protein|nr:hypothetical protein [Ilumatobacteraceae bacterium]
MPTVETADRHLSADLLLLDRDHLLVLKLGSIEQLLSESEGDPFASRVGSDRSGIDDAVLTLRAARRIPDELTVRVILPAGSTPSISTDQAQAALRRAAADQCGVGWREASAVRSMGRRQLPMGVTIALLAAVVAYGAAAIALDIDSVLVRALFVTLAGLAITVAWMVSWVVVEVAIYDWRDPAWGAKVYDLLARATLEVVSEENI